MSMVISQALAVLTCEFQWLENNHKCFRFLKASMKGFHDKPQGVAAIFSLPVSASRLGDR